MSFQQTFDVEWVLRFTHRLDAATRSGSLTALRDVLPADELRQLWDAASSLLAAEPTLLEVSPSSKRFVCGTVLAHTIFRSPFGAMLSWRNL